MTTTVEKPTAASARDILAMCHEQGVSFLRLQFTDILGVNKNVEVPESQFSKALAGEVRFDGSAIEGFVRVEESDMVLKPDLNTFVVLPYDDEGGRVARLLCDIYNPDGTPFIGCPRGALRRQIAKAQALGYEIMVGVEAEFYVFQLDANGRPTTRTLDSGGYFDLTPGDRAEGIRSLIVRDLVSMGFEVEGGHHEAAPGQHEIDFRYASALQTADNVATFKFVVRNVAYRHGYLATFMPQPIFGQAGSGMHTSHSLFQKGKNAFYDSKAQWELSQTALHYVAGLLRHARAFCAVTNPLVNSYKRLVPGYEAPVHVAWSMHNRSPLIRIPDRREDGTRCELRMPDPSGDPYLSLTVQIAAGLDGIRQGLTPPDPVNKNIFEMSHRERRHLRIDDLPRDLHEALEYLEKDDVIRDALGEHIVERFLEAKEREWREYIGRVSEWELNRYLGLY
ncbi:MAG TPA: type I glutamate--ammonia ligase [Gemmatimonadales bacterium]|nr:type I glutamate--ammonia ligase [Gemmatimonadales bacterium]